MYKHHIKRERMVYVAGKRFPLKNAVFQRQIAACGAVFRNGDRAGVQIEVFLAERLPRGYMCMAVQENIAGAERRQVRGVVDVAVRGADQPVSNREDAVIGQNREGCADFTGIFGEFTAAQRGDVRIALYIQRGNCLRIRREFSKEFTAFCWASRAPPLPTAAAFQRFLRKTNRL